MYEQQLRYGHPLQHVVYAKWWETVFLLASAPGAAVLMALMCAYDDDVWKSNRLCEQRTRCGDRGLEGPCSDFNRSMNYVFVFNAMAAVAMVTKAISISAFAYVQAAHNSPVSTALDLTTEERVQDGLFMWTSCAVCDLAAICCVCYRHGIFMLETHAQQLYPNSADATGPFLLLLSWMCTIFGCVCTSFAIYRLVETWLHLRDSADLPDYPADSGETVKLIDIEQKD